MADKRKTFPIENARIIFRNFSGAAGKYNPAGQRNFSVKLDEASAKFMIDEGWNVRISQPRDEDGDPLYHLPVKVEFANYPPKIVMITNRKTVLDESTVGNLDVAEIERVDLILSPYNYDVNGKRGIKAYLKSMYVTIATDEFEAKYRNIPDSAFGSIDD